MKIKSIAMLSISIRKIKSFSNMKTFLWKRITFLIILVGGSMSFFYYSHLLNISWEYEAEITPDYFDLSKNQDSIRAYIFKTDSKIDRRAFETYHLSVERSNIIGPFRTIPDTRDSKCNGLYYPIRKHIRVSIIISFHNEARSALLRTIVSILKRTPLKHLEEIILIDDYSRDDTDGLELLNFVPFVKLHRNRKREGLIRSRNRGAGLALGTYLMFLDSHCEVNREWLEPLLYWALNNPRAALSPVLDTIDAESFQYKASYTYLKGGFDWNLRFKWISMSYEERAQFDDVTVPFVAPAFSAGTFMISRKWFFQLGGFDSSLEIWGGESLEMSIKHWLCGGQIEVVPCSRIGHVFRKKYPYNFPGGTYPTYLRNSKRIAESWFDEYKHFFYSMKPTARDVSIEPNNNTKLLKKDLQCRPFSWYLMNVFPELKLPNEENIAFGQIKCGTHCLGFNSKDQLVKFRDCSIEDNSEWFLNARTGKLSSSTGACLNLDGDRVILEYCKDTNKNQRWLRNGGRLVHDATGLCLDNTLRDLVTGTVCRRDAPSQVFSFSIELQKL